jgi:hypothetical protein
VHTRGKPYLGKVVEDNDDGTYDIEWDPLPLPGGSDDFEPEDNIERRVAGSKLKRAKL